MEFQAALKLLGGDQIPSVMDPEMLQVQKVKHIFLRGWSFLWWPLVYLSGLVAEVPLLTPWWTEQERLQSAFGDFCPFQPRIIRRCLLGPPPAPDGQFREFPVAGVVSHRSTSLLVPSVTGSTYLSSPEVPGLNQGDTSLRSGVRHHFQGCFSEKAPPRRGPD